MGACVELWVLVLAATTFGDSALRGLVYLHARAARPIARLANILVNLVYLHRRREAREEP